MKDGSCLTDRKNTHMEAHGSTLILTVDDEPTNHLVIEEIVTSQGYQVNALQGIQHYHVAIAPLTQLCLVGQSWYLS